MRYGVWTISTLVALAGCGDDGVGEAGDEVASESSESGGASESESGGSADTTSETGSSDASSSESSETTGPEPFCGDGNVDRGEACDDANTNEFDGCLSDCTLVEPLDVPALEWTYVEVPGTRCMNGEVAGFGVSHNPESSNVMIYLEGGGACFNDTCDFTAFSIPFVPPIDGIFSRDNPANPVKDWTMIYVPYCTGDIHAGDAERELGGQLRQFRGYTNITTYLQQWVPSFPAERVLLTGISAGGFGAALNATQVADAYGEAVELTVIDDSGPPLSNDVIAPCLQTRFRETWNLDGTVLDACPQCDPEDFATDFLSAGPLRALLEYLGRRDQHLHGLWLGQRRLEQLRGHAAAGARADLRRRPALDSGPARRRHLDLLRDRHRPHRPARRLQRDLRRRHVAARVDRRRARRPDHARRALSEPLTASPRPACARRCDRGPRRCRGGVRGRSPDA
jgi:cysteine-rich repeat protein